MRRTGKLLNITGPINLVKPLQKFPLFLPIKL
jgi:hypothetical protein